MSKSKIEWTEETWNPTTGCNKVSAGCKNCYAERQHKRMMYMQPGKYTKPFLDGVELHENVLAIPLLWKKPKMVFVDSMSDLFHDDVPFEFIDKVFGVMASMKKHTFQVLTKRPERMHKYFSVDRHELIERWCDGASEAGLAIGDNPDTADVDTHWIWLHNDLLKEFPRKNIWLGTSVEDQKAADERIPWLIKIPAAIRFLSCEPLLGPIDISLVPDHDGKILAWQELNEIIHWVIAGGESGPGARPMHPDWARSLRDQCVSAGVPFFFKQWGEWIIADATDREERLPAKRWGWLREDGFFDQSMTNYHPGHFVLLKKQGKKKAGRLLDGREWNEFPNEINAMKQ